MNCNPTEGVKLKILEASYAQQMEYELEKFLTSRNERLTFIYKKIIVGAERFQLDQVLQLWVYYIEIYDSDKSTISMGKV